MNLGDDVKYAGLKVKYPSLLTSYLSVYNMSKPQEYLKIIVTLMKLEVLYEDKRKKHVCIFFNIFYLNAMKLTNIVSVHDLCLQWCF